MPLGLAVSPIGPEAGYIYTGNTLSGTVSVIDPTTNTVVDTITLPDAGDVAVSPYGPEAGDIYVTSDPSGSDVGMVSVIDPNSNAVVDTITIPQADVGAVAVSPAGPEAGDVYVVDGDSVVVISPEDNDVIATIPVTAGAYELAVVPSGIGAGDIYVTSETDMVSVINPATNTVTDTITLPGELETPSDEVVVDSFGVAAGSAPSGSADDVYVNAIMYDSPSSGTPTSTGVVDVINTNTNTVTDTISLPGDTYSYSDASASNVAVSPTGPYEGDVYVDNENTDQLYVINEGTGTDNTVIATISPSNEPDVPDVIAVSPIGPEAGDVYLGNLETDDSLEGSVSVVNPVADDVPE